MTEFLNIVGICLVVTLPCALLILLVTAHQYADGRPGSVVDAPGSWTSVPKRRSWARPHLESAYRRAAQAASWPSVVVQLAESYLAGEECGFALHDALLEAGKPELAETFTGPDSPLRLAVIQQIVDRC